MHGKKLEAEGCYPEGSCQRLGEKKNPVTGAKPEEDFVQQSVMTDWVNTVVRVLEC